MSDFWDSDTNDWDNFDYEDDSDSFGADEGIEIEYEVDEEEVVYETDVNKKRRLIIKKGAFYGIGIFLIGVGNALFKKARKWKRD